MRIIFIRHGDPDYKKDGLTEKGIREARLLSDRTAEWKDITAIYCSPYGRAQKTAAYSLKRMKKEAVTLPWLHEFDFCIDDPVTGRHGVPWDLMPEYWTEIPEMYGRQSWRETEIYRSNPALLPAYDDICQNLDELLSSYGFKRYHNYYRTGRTETPDAQDTTIVMLSHLLGISPAVLLHSFYIAPTSVTVLATEERIPGSASFRVQVMGDTSHLRFGNEPVSASGYFTDTFSL